MRSDASAPRGEGDLIAFGAPGVQIQIVDTDYRVRATGTGEVKARLPEGVYLVDWISAGRTQQKVVRLLAIERPLEVRQDPVPAGRTGKTLDAVATATPGSHLGLVLEARVAPSEVDRGSEVVVIIRAPTLDVKIDLSVGLRLLNAKDVAMRSATSDLQAMQNATTEGFVARLYRVEPGPFTLRYISFRGETLMQTVPALRGRRTVVFMSAGVGQVLMAEDGVYKPVDYKGVDPARTVIVTTALDAPTADLPEAGRLAEILLHDLATGEGSLGSAIVATLDGEDADPLLRLYATAVILTCLAARSSPALDEPWPSDSSAQFAFVNRWQARARAWIIRDLLAPAAPDLAAAAWSLENTSGDRLAPRLPLQVPPLLECAWRWAVAQSTEDPDAVPSTAHFRAAGRSAGGTAPWLTWRPSAAKGDIPVETDSLPGAIAAVVGQMDDLLATSDPDDLTDLNAILDRLTPEARAVALRVYEVGSGASPGADGAPSSGSDAAKTLATLFAAPAPRLAQMLKKALEELQEAASGPQMEAREPAEAPALRRMVMSSDDPNKGRFGGKAEVKGFVLAAAFEPTKSSNWVRIILELSAPVEAEPPPALAQIFVHDSFSPDRYQVPFEEGRATLTVTSWGGFTVGAWIASHGVELELDLAILPHAPRIVRER